jgi:diguanylate cyclase (GGDEF)-like protein
MLRRLAASKGLRALERFLRARQRATLSLALAGVVAVGFVDYALGPELASSIFYLDNFKEVNDAHGHQAGDELLRLVAQLLEANVRKADTVARLGGDEFALLMPDTELTNAKAVVGRLQARLLQAMRSRRYPVTFSIGVSVFQTPPASVEETIRAADQLMYAVKRSGKNRVRYEQFG